MDLVLSSNLQLCDNTNKLQLYNATNYTYDFNIIDLTLIFLFSTILILYIKIKNIKTKTKKLILEYNVKITNLENKIVEKNALLLTKNNDINTLKIQINNLNRINKQYELNNSIARTKGKRNIKQPSRLNISDFVSSSYD